MLTILEFHNISHRGIGWTNVPPARFADILDYLQTETEIIDPCDFYKYLMQPESARPPKVMLTFDDGYEEIYTRAFPLMRERGLTGMVSVVAGFTGSTNKWDIMGGGLRHLGWDQVSELIKSGWIICSHTMTHPDLKRCTDDRLDWELVESKKLLESRLGIPIPAIAYPFGRFNLRVLVAACRAGYKFGFTVGAERWKRRRGPLTIRRVPVYQIDPDALIRAKVKPNGPVKRFDALKNRAFNKLSLATSFVHRNSYKYIPQLP
ncbi:polysaccharide deacetylase family protein [candidate division WOR-3 bacterium]|uniref:Polysaccharide deacetylase family protein n=1 Tax=candidate division WOR-3 bacterium TaxID=2052148 RepID=A0A9D5KA84_UNCW3|nr:polysaccharide deacetylase family protein [candidate division WOR-3 bacterium]MBD3365332.1 polysaccharide deacetylase family protein [candidate division WOR-3 bacterium]